MIDKREEILGKRVYENTQDKQAAVSTAKSQLGDVVDKSHRMEMMVRAISCNATPLRLAVDL